MCELTSPVPTTQDGRPVVLSEAFDRFHRAPRSANEPRIAASGLSSRCAPGLVKVVGWNGRSRNVTLPSNAKSSAEPELGSDRSAPRVKRTNGKSDHAGCSRRRRGERLYLAWKHRLIGRDNKQGLVVNEGLERLEFGQASAAMPACPRSARATAASRPCGASIRPFVPLELAAIVIPGCLTHRRHVC